MAEGVAIAALNDIYTDAQLPIRQHIMACTSFCQKKKERKKNYQV